MPLDAPPPPGPAKAARNSRKQNSPRNNNNANNANKKEPNTNQPSNVAASDSGQLPMEQLQVASDKALMYSRQASAAAATANKAAMNAKAILDRFSKKKPWFKNPFKRSGGSRTRKNRR